MTPVFFDEVEKRNTVGVLGKAGDGSLNLDLHLSLVQEEVARNQQEMDEFCRERWRSIGRNMEV